MPLIECWSFCVYITNTPWAPGEVALIFTFTVQKAKVGGPMFWKLGYYAMLCAANKQQALGDLFSLGWPSEVGNGESLGEQRHSCVLLCARFLTR